MKRAEHYAEAERLCEKAKKLTEEYVEIDQEATKRKIDMEMLHRQLMDRAHVHAILASVRHSVAGEAFG